MKNYTAWDRLRQATNETPFEVAFTVLSLYLGVSSLALGAVLPPAVPHELLWMTMLTLAIGGMVTFIARLWREDLIRLERAGLALLVVAYACFPTYVLARIGLSFVTFQSVIPNYVVAFIFAHRCWTLGKALRIAKRLSRPSETTGGAG